ncbi:MAG: hypothetical protein ACI4I1_03220 [Oscillospiraceae bacterium]
MISESKKKANQKWDRENMCTLSCRMRKEEADYFKDWCRINHTTPGGMIKQYVNKCIEEYDAYMKKLHGKEE